MSPRRKLAQDAATAPEPEPEPEATAVVVEPATDTVASAEPPPALPEVVEACPQCRSSDVFWWPTFPQVGAEGLRRCRRCRWSRVMRRAR